MLSSIVSHGWVRGLQVQDIKKSVYFLVLFSIIAQLISRSLSDMISNTVWVHDSAWPATNCNKSWHINGVHLEPHKTLR
jgi:hypothetical protein